MELPEIKNSNVDVSVDGSRLTIQAETSQQEDADASSYKRSERFSGKLQRSLDLPANADTEHMHTSIDKGVLSITIPKLN